MYVKYKQLYGEKIGLPALVFGQGKGTSSDPELTALLQQTQRDKKLILALIHNQSSRLLQAWKPPRKESSRALKEYHRWETAST